MRKFRDFKCDTCEHVFERMIEDDQHCIDCVKCGLEAYRQLSAPKCFQNTTGKSPSASNKQLGNL